LSLHYTSGEEIKKGDRVLLGGSPAEIEEVADPEAPEAAEDWYLQNEGPGVLIREPKIHGRVFINSSGSSWDDVLFIGRQS
jgi:hypothetical protein